MVFMNMDIVSLNLKFHLKKHKKENKTLNYNISILNVQSCKKFSSYFITSHMIAHFKYI